MTGRTATTVPTDRRATTTVSRRAATQPDPPQHGDPLWTVAAGATPYGVDIERPNAARMHDFFLGGAHNFAVDRHAARAAIAAAPYIRETARASRGFLRRAVRYALGEGVRQFLDLGSGFPLHGSVHQIVHTVHAAAPVVYVDVDLVAVTLAHRLVDGNPAVGVVHADIRDMQAIVNHPQTRRLIDFTQPVCVLLVGVVEFIPGDLTHPMNLLHNTLSAGSQLVVAYAIDPGPGYAAQSDAVRRIYAQTPTPLSYRTADDIAGLLTGLDLIPPHDESGRHDQSQRPGMVAINKWRPDPLADDTPAVPLTGLLAGVARKPLPPATPGADQASGPSGTSPGRPSGSVQRADR